MSEGKYWQDEILCNNAGLENGDIWVNKDGVQFPISGLTDQHLINIVRKIQSSGNKDSFVPYDNLIKELRIRKIDLPETKDELEPLIGKEHDYCSTGGNDYDVIEGFNREDVMSAVKFCKRYIHDWGRLQKERPEIAKMCDHLHSDEEYNKWLIDYCFSDVAYDRD